jgi:hypothetical protein
VLYWDVVYGANSVDAVIRRLPYQAGATSANRLAMAAALDLVRPVATGDLAGLLLHVDNQHDPEQYGQALDRLGPAWSDGLTRGALVGLDSLQDAVARRQSAERRGHGLQASAARAGITVRPDPAADDTHGWQVWGDSGGILGGEETTPTAAGYRYLVHSNAAGCDHRFGPVMVGGNVAAAGATVGGSDAGGHGTVDSWRSGGYGSVAFGPITIDGAAGLGGSEFHGQRAIQFGVISREARSAYTGHEIYAQLGGGWDVWSGDWNFGADLAGRWRRIAEDAYAETGALSLNLRVAERHAAEEHALLGAHAGRAFETAGVLWFPTVDLRWDHAVDPAARSVAANLAYAPWANLTVTGREPPGNALRGTTAIEVIGWGLATVTARYQADFVPGRGLGNQAGGVAAQIGF